MKISGFSMVRDGVKLYYPVVPMIRSILPLVDEFVIAIGRGDPDDTTREDVAAIGDPKIRIIDTEWNLERYPRGMENAHQTDMAKEACTGDWLFYLQADEVVHERDLPVIRRRCRELLDDRRVEGLLFDYLHFWGDYSHYHVGHGWYPYEIRVIRNDPEIHSWESAQSFRRIPDFDGLSYRRKEGTRKLRVAKAHATIYHYGWVRPPRLMRRKKRSLDTIHKGSEGAMKVRGNELEHFDYGPLDRLKVFRGSHPAVMRKTIERMDWSDSLQASGKPDPSRPPHKHERLKYRLLTWIEQHLLGGRHVGDFRNYVLLKDV
ncbi:hypothetical protein GF402_01350 [Candidatus Fermentibacteria bacterium]|nr:hypothetical protein [Candidatus Fermentibacteria bacterium]